MITETPTRPAGPAPAAPGDSSRRLMSPPVLLALLAVLAGVVAGGLYLVPQPPAEDSADVGFARDMSGHHAQAVAMAETIRERSNDPELRVLAADIALTQLGQIGRMSAWLDLWGAPRAAPAPAWPGRARRRPNSCRAWPRLRKRRPWTRCRSSRRRSTSCA